MDSGFSKFGVGGGLFERSPGEPAFFPFRKNAAKNLQLCAGYGFLFGATMSNQSDNSQESLWRRKLSEAESAGLRAQPELELEARLTEALARIPDAPVPSNFTARVLAAVDLEASREMRSRAWTLSWRLLWPRAAVAAAILIFAGVSFQRYEVNSHRIALARNVAMLSVRSRRRAWRRWKISTPSSA